MGFASTVGVQRHHFSDLRELMAKATAERSGDQLAGIAAGSAAERVAARAALADLPLATLLEQPLVPYETDAVTRLIVDTHDGAAFAPVAHLTVGALRDWLLSDAASTEALRSLAPGLTPEMVAAVSKLMRNQDLMAVARKCSVVTHFRNTLGLPGHLAVRLQPNHPSDSPAGILASVLDGLMYGAGDAVIGVNPASDSVSDLVRLLHLFDELISRELDAARSLVVVWTAQSVDSRWVRGGARDAADRVE